MNYYLNILISILMYLSIYYIY